MAETGVESSSRWTIEVTHIRVGVAIVAIIGVVHGVQAFCGNKEARLISYDRADIDSSGLQLTDEIVDDSS